jgi:TonB family protein
MKAIVIIGVILVAAGAGLRAQDSLSAAKDLYASAAYEDALSTLSRMDAAGGADARQVDEYRAFCLFALGRTREAESVAESIIRREPLARLDAADASPRLEVMFTDVRRRLLPSLIRDRFRIAKSSLDQKSYAAAEPPLAEARLMILDAEKIGVKDDGLADLSILVDGFLQLIHSAADQRASQQAAVASPVAAPAAPRPGASPLSQGAAAGSRQATSPPVQTAANAPRPAASSAAPASASGPRVYSIDDEGVIPPVAIEQRMPAMTPQMQMITRAMKTNGVIDVLVDEEGRVLDATIRQSLNSNFDTLIVRTARQWKYRPAMKDGVAVRFVKTLVLVP